MPHYRKMVRETTINTEAVTTTTGTSGSAIVLTLVENVQQKLAASNNPSPEQLEGYANVLNAAAELQKALPTKTVTTFSLPLPEIGILAIYLAGGVGLMIAITQLLPGASWKADNLVTAFLYWTVVVGILLGANGLSSLLGGKDSSSKTK